MEARAILRYARISPRKVSIVMDLIRNKPLDEALAILQYTPKAACEPLLKLVKSAAANAENNFNMDKNNLYVAGVLRLPRPDAEAHDASCTGPRLPHPEAHQPHDRCSERERVRRENNGPESKSARHSCRRY